MLALQQARFYFYFIQILKKDSYDAGGRNVTLYHNIT